MITRKTTYALRALSHLAGQGGEITLTSRIAATEGIPLRFLEAILRELSRHGVLSVKRGRGGGYALKHHPGDITVARVVEIVDGHDSHFPCLNPQSPERCAECPGKGPCAAERALSRVGSASQRVLQTMTLADISQPELSLQVT